jgi:hypothetical protein
MAGKKKEKQWSDPISTANSLAEFNDRDLDEAP